MPTSAKRKKRPRTGPFHPLVLKRARAVAARYRIALWREDGEWYAEGIEEPGAMGDGRTIQQAVRSTREALTVLVAHLIESGHPVTTPLVDQERKRRRKAG